MGRSATGRSQLASENVFLQTRIEELLLKNGELQVKVQKLEAGEKAADAYMTKLQNRISRVYLALDMMTFRADCSAEMGQGHVAIELKRERNSIREAVDGPNDGGGHA